MVLVDVIIIIYALAIQRSYVMKELMSTGWDSKEKDKNMTEVSGVHCSPYPRSCVHEENYFQVNILSSCNHLNIIR